jgi:hypothetical protein
LLGKITCRALLPSKHKAATVHGEQVR